MSPKTYALILAGGSGTRFWPVSRAAHPKQFLDVLGKGHSLLQATFLRVRHLIPDQRIWVVGNAQHEALLREQLPDLAPQNLLLEPLQRNTAPSILWASLLLLQEDPEALLWILPADHYIPDEEPFLRLIHEVLTTCDFSQAILTIGIKPSYPHTGYGYIQFVPVAGSLCQPVKTFTEKPSRELAEVFLQSGDFLWNSGMFLAKASVLVQAFMEHAPELYEAFQGIAEREGPRVRAAFQQAPSISFDYAVMEKYHPVMVVEGRFPWWDLGGWKALHEVHPHDPHQNSLRGEVYTHNVTNTLLFAQPPTNSLS